MRIGLMIEGQEGVGWEQWLALALAAEEAGLDGLFRSDHYRSIHRGDPAGSLDAWAMLAALAARTQRIRLGTLVSPTTFRPASVLAKNVVTVDHISGGRVELGIGAGWFEPDHDSLRLPLRHGRRADGRVRAPARGDQPPVDAPRRRSGRSRCSDRARRSSSAAAAKPRSVRAAVRFADEYNTVVPTLEQARERCEIVRRAAAEAGRAPLRFSMMTTCALGRDEAEVNDRLRGLGRGFDARSPPGAGRHRRAGRRGPGAIRGRRRRAGDAPAPRARGRRDGRAARRARAGARRLRSQRERRAQAPLGAATADVMSATVTDNQIV